MSNSDNAVQNNRIRIPGSAFSIPAPPAGAHYSVYRLTDPLGKIYIGCTSRRVKRRWGAGKNYSRGTPIRCAIDRYGWKNFRHEILCENLTRAAAEEKEKWFIDYFDSANPEKGYNCYLGGLGKGSKMCEAMRLRMVGTKLYEQRPELIEQIRNSVNRRYAEDATYCVRVQAAVSAIYEKEPERKAAVSRQMKEYLSHPENRKFVLSDAHPKPVMCVETGEIFPSQKAAEKAAGFCGVHKACQGIQQTCGAYHWRYLSAEEKEKTAR